MSTAPRYLPQYTVDDYPLIDPEAETLEVYRQTGNVVWNKHEVADSIELSLCDDCELSITRSDLFR